MAESNPNFTSIPNCSFILFVVRILGKEKNCVWNDSRHMCRWEIWEHREWSKLERDEGRHDDWNGVKSLFGTFHVLFDVWRWKLVQWLCQLFVKSNKQYWNCWYRCVRHYGVFSWRRLNWFGIWCELWARNSGKSSKANWAFDQIFDRVDVRSSGTCRG